MKRRWSRGMAFVAAAAMLCGTGCGSKEAAEDPQTFSWWIYSTDAVGTYYESYEENPAVQWLNQQYWDTNTGGLGTKENGKNIKFTFQVPITGAEKDNYNTMVSTGEYTDILDLQVAEDSAQAMYEQGILLELTDYVEKYCPNYVKYLDEHPDIKARVTNKDEDGKVHYYEMANIKDSNDIPWGGYVYRRDWVVKYAQPTEYVWDWDSEQVRQNGHPAVTPLSKAMKEGNLTGWKKNEVTKFEAAEGKDPDAEYSDNVIFPSGKTDPYTVSDWEWMFEAFEKAIADRGWEKNPDSYCTSLYYLGYLQTGDLVSSFGAGNGSWCMDADHQVSFTGTSDAFQTYLNAMNTWYRNGWVDTKFETRASDQFFSINESGCARGMVGMWYGTMGIMGDTIRVTCENEQDKEDAFVMPCACPINDIYGTEDQKYREPDCFFQGERVAGNIGITRKAEKKDLKTLFTYFNWMYSRDGSLLRSFGLNQEQLDEADIKDNIYEEYDLPGAYTVSVAEDGKTKYTSTYAYGEDIGNAIKPNRMSVGLSMMGTDENLDYELDKNAAPVTQHAIMEWTKYTNSAGMLSYGNYMTEEENKEYNITNNKVNDIMGQMLPVMIKEGLGTWDEYVKKIEECQPDAISEIYQKEMDILY